MCGICGILVFNNSSYTVSEGLLNEMRDAMDHRGPDDAGNWISANRKVGLGHRRLSIIDLSSNAKQPMCNREQSIWVSFNGEIYNFQEIKDELNRIRTIDWKTDHSDTEVIIYAFETWGIECLQRFRGMFAIAIWDDRNRELWLVRDRMGIKPLYYSLHHGRITFASEIKSLLKDPDQARNVNEESLYHYLSFLTTPAPDTLFDGIKKIPNGVFLRIKEDGSIFESRYYDIWEHTKPLLNVSEAQIAEMVLEELTTAVELRQVGDVPMGVFLSGGIDSSTNAALFAKNSSVPIETFTIGYQGDYESYKNENEFARMIADQIGANYHEKLLNADDLIRFLPKMIALQDEPIADPVCVPLFYVSELARNSGVTVCQVGEGADELFWGYIPWKEKLNQQESLNRLPVAYAKAYASLLKLAGRDQGFRYESLKRHSEGRPIFWGGAEAFTQTTKQMVLSPRLEKQFRNLSSWSVISPIRKRFEELAWEKSTLHWMSYLDLNFRLPELLLMRVDKMSMGVSLECRVPFLDHKFVELAMSIPTAIKTKDQISKSLLKRSVRGLIPDILIDRKKQGFGVPINEWLFEKLGARVDREIAEFSGETDIISAKGVRKLFENPHNHRKKWYLLNLALWWKEYVRN